MSLFEQRVNMHQELAKLERLMPSYKDLLLKLSKVIRNHVWGVSDESNLAVYLNRANCIFAISVEVLGETFYLIDMYIDLLCKQSRYFTSHDITGAFGKLKMEIAVLKTQELIKEQWKQLNPLFSSEYDNDDIFKKNILELFDDVYRETIELYPDAFTVNLGSINNICRGRGGKKTSTDDVLPPQIGVGGINRWNPPSKRYGYYAVSTIVEVYDASFTWVEKTCYEELRKAKGDEITFADFTVVPIANNSVIMNLDYSEISRRDVEQIIINSQNQLTSEIVSEMLKTRMTPEKSNITKMIATKSPLSNKAVRIYCGKLFFKELCDAIFIPIDDDQVAVDSLYKEKCYTSFHLLAEYLESKRIKGVLFPSTRMMLLGKSGTNLVLFNPDDVAPIDTSLRTKTI